MPRVAHMDYTRTCVYIHVNLDMGVPYVETLKCQFGLMFLALWFAYFKANVQLTF